MNELADLHKAVDTVLHAISCSGSEVVFEPYQGSTILFLQFGQMMIAVREMHNVTENIRFKRIHIWRLQS